jgi:hypothetical protein
MGCEIECMERGLGREREKEREGEKKGDDSKL